MLINSPDKNRALTCDEGTHSETVHCFITRPHLADVMRCGGFDPILDPKPL